MNELNSFTTIAMRFSTQQVFLWLFGLLIPGIACATHQVGGQLEMQATGRVPGEFRILITNYLEAGPRADQQQGGILAICRKRDNLLVATFNVNESGQRQKIIYANEFCAQQRNLNFLVATFEATIYLNPAAYFEPEGYYIGYQTRARNGGINNISAPLQTGYTFYLEFPALTKNGQFFTNSSPRFGSVNGEYICINEPFTFAFGGTDPDGDELRYSLVTPLNQRTSQQNLATAGPYPDVIWLSGFSATNAIPGNPALSVDSRTGQLSVKASQLGLFVFAVNVEEFRDGVKIGEVRRDFQFLVVECPPNVTVDPTVSIKNQPPSDQSTTICQGERAILQAVANPDWNYQWQRDGINLANATSATYNARDPGQYTVLVSPKTQCSKVGTSEMLTVVVIGSQARLRDTGHLCATTGSVTLTVSTQEQVRYQWFNTGQAIAGKTDSTATFTQPGQYWAVLTYPLLGCTARTDTMTIARSAVVVATLKSATGQNRICPNDSLWLNGTGGIRYAWSYNGNGVLGETGAQYRAKSTGTYTVTAIDGYDCTGVSAPIVLVPVPPIIARFDSIPGVCGINNPIYTLRAEPPGGVFSGTGVQGAGFSPSVAGIGIHTLTYAVRPAPECTDVLATRIAVVAPIPTITLADTISTWRGNTITLNPTYTGGPNWFRWASAIFLDNPQSPTPTVQAVNQEVVYIIDVKNSTGCAATDTVRILVVDRVWVPDAFTPNGDGQNDVWELPGIEAYPDAELTIFSRWGEVVFWSPIGPENLFDGTLKGSPLPTGVYTYALRIIPDKPPLRGHVLLLR
jgi:gliding motility-associated-like protein